MTSATRLLLSLTSQLAIASVASFGADPPVLIHYQGVLRNDAGAPLDGSFDMEFAFHDAAVGGDEILVDVHETAGSGAVPATGGLFGVSLGSGQVLDGTGAGTYTSLRDVFRDFGEVYLQVTIEGETLSPRTRVLASAYALSAAPRGVTYTRWGRSDCPAGTELVYSGVVAAGEATQSGGISSQLCLTLNPTWDAFNDGDQNGALLYGTEFETAAYGVGPLAFLQNSDAQCAVCLQPDADQVRMHPGSQDCPGGWTREYRGYLMATFFTQVPREAVCVDRASTPGGSSANANANLWYPTEAECGSLPCPPYVQNREITCSVCSR